MNAASQTFFLPYLFFYKSLLRGIMLVQGRLQGIIYSLNLESKTSCETFKLDSYSDRINNQI